MAGVGPIQHVCFACIARDCAKALLGVVVEAAGGVVCDWSGNPVPKGGRVIASANDTLLAAALATLNA